jgi:hypothetical protein
MPIAAAPDLVVAPWRFAIRRSTPPLWVESNDGMSGAARNRTALGAGATQTAGLGVKWAGVHGVLLLVIISRSEAVFKT